MSAYVLPAAKAEVARVRTQAGRTNAEVVFDAIDAVHHELPHLIAARNTVWRPEDSLFPARVQRRRRQQGRGPAETAARRILWTLRATTAELEILDRMAGECGAESRSELISVAVEAALLPRGQQAGR